MYLFVYGTRIESAKLNVIYLQVAPGGSADKCGVKNGDIITSIQDKTTDKMTISQCQDIIKMSSLEFKIAVTRLKELTWSGASFKFSIPSS